MSFLPLSAESPDLMYSKIENLDCDVGFGVGILGLGGGFVMPADLIAPPAVMPMD